MFEIEGNENGFAIETRKSDVQRIGQAVIGVPVDHGGAGGLFESGLRGRCNGAKPGTEATGSHYV